ncbi:hypothetical protein OS493_003928 [Desmophyllum pertusum]|uniref:Uncharacterized protein n=1 Tax=Desmophyllum pertusum TaxID=174260 RepID=A0A9X0D586_9CNID|nr:hypothetical protein OS493_003928 [Desmophyllum pertusum]
MASLRKFARLAAVASAAVTFSGAYVISNSTRNPARASGGGLYPEEFEDRLLYKPSGLRWDPNWDMCEKGAKKPKRKDDVRVDERIEGDKAHRVQANTTGQRLKDLDFKYTKLICSTLIRATETADIIA